jgi:hypothetical protein
MILVVVKDLVADERWHVWGQRGGYRWSASETLHICVANSDREQMQGCKYTNPDLLHHLVGAAEEGKRDSQSESLGGFEVKDQFDFGGLLDRQVGRFLSLEDAPGIET